MTSAQATQPDHGTQPDHHPKTSNTNTPQVDPGDTNADYESYRLSSTETTAVGIVIATTAHTPAGYTFTDIDGANYTFGSLTEYWNLPSALVAFLNAPNVNDTLTFTPTSDNLYPNPPNGILPGFTSGATVASMAQPTSSLNWTKRPAAFVPQYAFWDGNLVCVGFTLTSPSAGSLTWYYLGVSKPTGNLISAAGPTTLTYGTAGAAPRGLSWWSAPASITGVKL